MVSEARQVNKAKRGMGFLYKTKRDCRFPWTKLDEGQEVYLEKLKALLDEARINTLTVVTMQVPCCMGLLRLAQEALAQAARKVPLKHVVIALNGEVLSEDWVAA